MSSSCKAKVLARFPEARLVILRRYPDCTPKYAAVYVATDEEQLIRLDIHEPPSQPGWSNVSEQLGAAAWRSAYQWCRAHPSQDIV